MSGGALIDDHVSVQQCKRAVEALLSHVAKFEEKKAETQLLPGKEQNVWLVVNTKLMQPEKKLKPARIPLKYPVVDPRTSPVCLITKDPQRQYKDLIAERGIKFISRVVDIKHLKGKWKPFEARRLLLREYGLFLADDRVIPLLPGLLGKIFFEAKKQPIPVCMTRKDLKGELERAISSTYFHQNKGTCTSVKIGTASQKPSQVLENLQTALPEVVKHIKGGWDNIQSFFIKTNSSAALPIWQCHLGADAGGRWDGLVAGASEDGDEETDNVEESGSEGDMEVDKPATVVKGKGKKRAAEVAEAEGEREQPKKKAKPAVELSVPGEVKGKTAEPAPTTTVSTSASEPTQKKRRKSTVDPVIAPATEPKLAQIAQEDQGEVAPEAAAPPSGPATEEKKRKRRKSRAAADANAALAAAASSPKRTDPAPAASEPVQLTEAPSAATSSGGAQPAKKEKRKKARASLAAAAAAAAAEASDATALAPTPANLAESEQADVSAAAVPATPSVPKKKRRASAVDFFENTAATPATRAAVPPNPPNTPADGLLAVESLASGKRKKRAKNATAETPVTTAISKLAAQPELPTPDSARSAVAENNDVVTPGADTETPSGKKQRKRKQKEDKSTPQVEGTPSSAPGKEDQRSASTAGAEDTPAKKLKRKRKAAPEAAGSTPSLNAEEMKQKKSIAGVEKKKEKVVGAKPAAKSAKDAVVGKKRL
ncbi:ribosomal protein L1p/L10e family-domain-containing protein [Trametes punicea]|nr:ribosomal protein L1p/L10e family-domain-containing protein [Trametes punicea]